MTTQQYEIGGYSVHMTPRQARRWNEGRTTPNDLDVIRVSIGERYITLRRALNVDLSPDSARDMADMPANLMG